MGTTRCTAKVLELRSTGTRINNEPELWFALEVERGAGRYRAETVAVVPVEWMPRVQPGSMLQVEVDAANPASVRIDLSGHEPIADVLAEAKPVALEGPIWLFGWRSPRPWLMPWTVPGVLVVAPLANRSPHDPDQKLAPGLWLAWAEHIGLWTRIDTRGVIWVAPGKKIIGYMPGPLRPFQDFTPMLAQIGQPITGMLWGELAGDNNVALHMRAIPRDADTVRPATYENATAVFLGWLHELGLVAPVALAPWFAAPTASVIETYSAVLEKLLCVMLADKRVLPALSVAFYTSAFDSAIQLAQQPGAPPQCRLFPLTVALHAAKAGCLDDARRGLVLDLVRRTTDPADVTMRLSPHFFRALGATADADAADRRARASAGGDAAYLAWLDTVARPE